MRDVSCKLISKEIVTDKIGIQKEVTQKREIPIIKIEDVYSKEFYQASEQGFKPSLRLRISALNYNYEDDLEYMKKMYSIIRVQEVTTDEIVLVCERKIANV